MIPDAAIIGMVNSPNGLSMLCRKLASSMKRLFNTLGEPQESSLTRRTSLVPTELLDAGRFRVPAIAKRGPGAEMHDVSTATWILALGRSDESLSEMYVQSR